MSRVKKSRGSKFLALVVALTFLLSMAAPAFASAPADLQQSEANRLKTLGIIAGFPDGSLGLDRTISRAEFAKVIAIATGNEIIADAMVNSPTKFSDAKVGVWYTGYVNVASELGYILGYPDGTFKPNQPITNAEVLTILLRALGYDDRLPGSWPTDYLVKANELGITDDVTFAAKAAALRGDAFIFTSRTLDTDMVSWSSDANDFLPRTPAITLLAKAFQGTTNEGVLVDLKWDDGTLIATIATVVNNAVKTAECEVVSTPVISGAEGILGLLAKEVSYITNSDDQIIYLSAQDTNVVTDDAITKVAAKEANINDKNYDLVDDFAKVLFAFPGKVPVVTSSVYEADRVTAVLDGGDIMAVLFEEYMDPGIVESVEDDYITVVDGSLSDDPDLEDEDYAVIKDGALASLDDLEAGDLVYVVADAHGLDYLIVAVSKDNAIEGTLEKANSDFSKITVDGTEYDVDDDAIASSNGGDSYDAWANFTKSDFMGEDVAILLSPAGKVAAITADFEAEAGLYGILTAADTAGFDEYKVKIMTSSGDSVVFDVDEDSEDVPATLSAAQAYQNKLVEYKLNSKGEIDSITAITKEATVEAIDKDNNRIKLLSTNNGTDESWFRVTDSSVFFAQDDSDWQTVSWSTFAKAEVGEAVYYVVDGIELVALAYYGAVSATGDYGVILDASYNPDGAYYELIVLGDRVTYNLDTPPAPGTTEWADVVGLVYSFDLNADNEIALDSAITSTVFDDVVAKVVYGTVKSFSSVGRYIELYEEGFYDLDAETSIVDVSGMPAGNPPEVKTSVGKDKTVVLYIDEDDFVDYILIVDEDQLEKYID